MSSHRHLPIGQKIVLLVCFGFSACASQEAAETCVVEDAPPLEAKAYYPTQFADIYAMFEYPICAGTLEQIDGRIVDLAEQLDLELTRRVPVFLSDSPAEIADLCPPWSLGCLRLSGEVVARPEALWHELAHGVACELGQSDIMLSEGFAVGFDGAGHFMRDEWYEPLETITGGSTTDYGTAGHFVRWLHSQGDSPFRKAYSTLSRAEGVERVSEALGQVYGNDLHDLEADFAAERPAYYPPAFEQCDGRDIAWDAGGWTIDVEFDCDKPTTFGPHPSYDGLLEGPLLYQTFTLEGRDDLEYHLEIDGQAEEWVLGDPLGEFAVLIDPCLSEEIEDEMTADDLIPTGDREPSPLDLTYVFLPGQRYRIEVAAPIIGGPSNVVLKATSAG